MKNRSDLDDIMLQKSIVEVHFPKKNTTLSYFNDRSPLNCGDLVYVEGKLAGITGRVVSLNYNFKIKASEYKRVTSVVDTNVSGQFHMAGSHFVSFDPDALPKSKVRSWYFDPHSNNEDFIYGSDGYIFSLNNLKEMKITEKIAERGYNYYMDNRVRYICLNGTEGYAIIEGTEPYEVEFQYVDGNIRSLNCSCLCGFDCKHEFAAMLQLKETLGIIEKNYTGLYKNYFSAVNKATLFAYAIDGKTTGSFLL